MNRLNANTNILYKLHPMQWSVVALLVLNLIAPFAPSEDESALDLMLEDIGHVELVDSLLLSDENIELSAKGLVASETTMPPQEIQHSLSTDVSINPQLMLEEEVLSGIGIHKSQEEKLICYEIGPVTSNEVEAGLKRVLMPKGMALDMSVVKHQEAIGYWVFLPPLRSKALGRLKVEEIKLKGIRDVVLLTKNNPKFAISLGIFETKKFATKRLLEIQSLGFDAKLETRYKSLDEKWMVVEVAERDDNSMEAWDELVGNYQPIEIRQIDCK